ncbi:MAG: molybdopterin-binding protein [Mariprofundaceae bacterium]
MSPHQTAAILIIGNEVLSGRTREANAWLASRKLFERGCKVKEIAIVPDLEDNIIDTLNRLRKNHDAVITSGGIGPTHDDITMQAIAHAFDVQLVEHGHIIRMMTEHYGENGVNAGRRRMSRVPKGSRLIRCEKTIAPGAHIDNVYILAGVPIIFESQLASILTDFGDQPFIRHEIQVNYPESLFAAQLETIQQRFNMLEIGSYPSHCGKNPTGKICISGQDKEKIQHAELEVHEMLDCMAGVGDENK